MCKHDQSVWWLLALFLLVLFFSVRTVSGDEANVPMLNQSEPSTPQASPLTISGWQLFDEAWTNLQAELIASAEDSTRQLELLLQLQTELGELRSSLTQSEALLKQSGESLAIERQRALDALELLKATTLSKDRWRSLAVLSGAIAGVAIIAMIF